VVALFEHGAEGPLAAPISRDVLKAYFDKKARLAADAATRRQGDTATKTSEFQRFGLPVEPVAPPPPESPIIEAAYFSSDDEESPVAASPRRRVAASLLPHHP